MRARDALRTCVLDCPRHPSICLSSREMHKVSLGTQSTAPNARDCWNAGMRESSKPSMASTHTSWYTAYLRTSMCKERHTGKICMCVQPKLHYFPMGTPRPGRKKEASQRPCVGATESRRRRQPATARPRAWTVGPAESSMEGVSHTLRISYSPLRRQSPACLGHQHQHQHQHPCSDAVSQTAPSRSPHVLEKERR